MVNIKRRFFNRRGIHRRGIYFDITVGRIPRRLKTVVVSKYTTTVFARRGSGSTTTVKRLPRRSFDRRGSPSYHDGQKDRRGSPVRSRFL